MNLIHILANSFGPEVLPSQVMKVSWSLVTTRWQRLQDFFFNFYFYGGWRGRGQGEIRHDLFVGALPPSEVERGRSVASPGGRLVSDTKYVQTTWRL